MFKNIEVIELNGTELKENKDNLDYLDQIGKSVTIDFEREEICFFLSAHKIIVLDFDETKFYKLTDVELSNVYDELGNEDLPEIYQEYLDILNDELVTDVRMIGQGDYRALAIKIYDCYFVAFNILIDTDNDFNPHDPDDGESILGSFLFLKFSTIVSQE
jgi:hypothetical protein